MTSDRSAGGSGAAVEPLSRAEQIDHLRTISEEMVRVSEKALDAEVQHCPGWKVRDLVAHIADVQWFWADIVERGVTRYEDRRQPPGPPPGTDMVAWFSAQTKRLVDRLATWDARQPLWTWWAPDQSIAFIARRQLNEVAVHAWDAANAAGVPAPIERDVAILGLEEFAEVFVHDLKTDVAAPPPLRLETTDAAWSTTLFSEDGTNESTVPARLELRANASDLLLTMWQRRPADDERVAAALAAIDLS